MKDILKGHRNTLFALLAILLVLGFVTYQFISVSGVFSDLKNDLKSIEPEIGSEYQNLNGEPVSLNDFKGSVLMVNSWATWSPYSREDLLLLRDLQQQFENNVTILAINRKETLPTIKSYLRTFNIEFDSLVFLYDPTDHFYTASGGYAMPETVVYAKDGTIATHYRGTLDKEAVLQLLETLTDK